MPNKTETLNKEGVQIYELGYLILPSIAESELSNVVDKLKTIVEKVGGVQIAGEDPFKIDLAYTMAKTIGASRYVVNNAYIGWMKFELEPMQALNLKSSVDKVDEILRSLLIKAPRETEFTFAKARIMEESDSAPEAVVEGAEEVDSSVAEPVVE